MSSISTSLQRLCFIHPHSGILLTSLRLLTSIHLSGALACTLVIRRMLSDHHLQLLGALAGLPLVCLPLLRQVRSGETAELEGREPIINIPPHLSRNSKANL